MAKKAKDERPDAISEAFGAQTQPAAVDSLSQPSPVPDRADGPPAGQNGAVKKTPRKISAEERECLLYYSVRGMARGSATWDVIVERPRKKTAMRYIDQNLALLRRVYERLEIVKCKRAAEVWRI